MTGPATAAADDALVQQHYAWVRAAAMRQVRDPHVADDVAQAVFIVLMQKKLEFNSDAALSAWLFQTMRYAAAHAMRSQRRRAHHEARAAQAKQARAAEMQSSQTPSSHEEWERIAPLLDESVARLRQDDRQAVLLRFYQQKTFVDVGAAMGISEEAARKRVNRAVDKLRDAIARRGVAVPAGAVLATTLMTHATPTTAAGAAPIIAAAAATTTASAAEQIAKGIAMSWTPGKIAAVTIAAVLAAPAVATVAWLSLGTNAPSTASAPSGGAPRDQSSSAPAQPPTAPATDPAQPVSQTDPIIPDDLLSVALSDLVGPGIVTVKQCRVDPQSTITLPLIGLLSVKEMTLDQAERAGQKAYRDANLMPNARLEITRVESGKSPSVRWAPVATGDFVRVEIADLAGPGITATITERVPDSGQLSLPLAGSIKVQGLSETELTAAIQALYRRKNLMPNAQVHVQRITEQQAAGQPRLNDQPARDGGRD